MSTTTITVHVDADTQIQAENILNDIGVNITTLFNACLKALVREKRIPFSLSDGENEWQQEVRSKLEVSLAEATDPYAKRYTHEEIFAPLREKYGYENEISR